MKDGTNAAKRADFTAIGAALDRASEQAEQDFEVNYEGFRANSIQAALYFLDAMFPSYSKLPEQPEVGETPREHYLKAGYTHLARAFEKTMPADEALTEATELVERLPEIYEKLQSDMLAGFEGDPAAKSVDEVILAYPAFLAIGIYRIAHELYLMGRQVVARLMSEYAHRETGIDIHPGATIGRHFFIDHGTGVVIGETCCIGDNVKLYQHVTLGAKSFPVADDGTLVKGIKRHPNIGNDVVIYAGATILGGDVFIGDGCVIGGNVWLTRSVEPGVTVLQKSSAEFRGN